MTLPNVLLTLLDGQSGLIGQSGHPLAVIGTAAAGTANTLVAIGDLKTLLDTFVSGPLVELAASILAESGGPVYACRCSASNNGSNGSVTLSGTGPSPGAAPSGNPLDSYEVRVKIVVGGARGTATFKISFDGGDTWSEEFLTAASVATWATETGLTITFTNTSPYVAGDVYSWTSTGPTYDSTDLNTALDAVHASPYYLEGVWIAGTVGGVDDATKVTNWVALATAVGAKLTAWETGFRYCYGGLMVPVVADSALAVSGVSNFVHARVVGCAGDVEMQSQANKRQIRRNCMHHVAARAGKVDLQRSLAAVRDGTLPGIVSLYRDERVTPALESLRFTVLRTFDSAAPGFFVAQALTFAAPGSDYKTLERRRVIDRACTITRAAFLPYLEEDIEVNANGTIEEKAAVAIETVVHAYLAADLVKNGRASAVEVQINRTQNLQTTETLKVKVRVRPKGKARWIEVEIGFSNPNLAAAA